MFVLVLLLVLFGFLILFCSQRWIPDYPCRHPPWMPSSTMPTIDSSCNHQFNLTPHHTSSYLTFFIFLSRALYLTFLTATISNQPKPIATSPPSSLPPQTRNHQKPNLKSDLITSSPAINQFNISNSSHHRGSSSPNHRTNSANFIIQSPRSEHQNLSTTVSTPNLPSPSK